jgi:hypothetical protein
MDPAKTLAWALLSLAAAAGNPHDREDARHQLRRLAAYRR